MRAVIRNPAETVADAAAKMRLVKLDIFDGHTKHAKALAESLLADLERLSAT